MKNKVKKQFEILNSSRNNKSKILKTLYKNNDKVNDIIKINKELKTLTNERNVLIKKIKNLYNIIFKNFSSERIVIENKYVISNKGISVVYPNNILGNAKNLNQFEDVLFIKYLYSFSNKNDKNVLMIENYLSKEKCEILKKFFKEVKYLKIKNTKININKKIENYSMSERKIVNELIENISITNYDNISINEFILMNTDNIKYESYIYIEQLYPKIMKLLKKAKEQRIEELINFKKYINYIHTEFENTLALEELTK